MGSKAPTQTGNTKDVRLSPTDYAIQVLAKNMAGETADATQAAYELVKEEDGRQSVVPSVGKNAKKKVGWIRVNADKSVSSSRTTIACGQDMQITGFSTFVEADQLTFNYVALK